MPPAPALRTHHQTHTNTPLSRRHWVQRILDHDGYGGEAGGIEAVDAGGFDDDASLVEAFVASGATVAVLCSSDAVYADRAVVAAAALRTVGAARLLLAGHPGERRADYTDAGIGAFIHLGVDVLASLRTLHDHLGVSA